MSLLNCNRVGGAGGSSSLLFFFLLLVILYSQCFDICD